MSRALSDAEVSGWDAEADVLVVGVGAAGVCAAIEAASTGASVLCLERAGGPGGTTAVSDGMIYLGGGTALQRACGFEDSIEEMQKYLLASCGPEPDAERIRVYCEESPGHFDWLVAQGVPFKAEFYPERMMAPGEQGLTYSGNELVYPFRELAKPAPRAHMAQKEGSTGAFLMQRLEAAARRAGAQIRSGVLCERLVVDAAGRVVGVIATQEGRPCAFRARRGVVLCAGGFVNNREMVRRHAPELRRARFRAASEGDDGRGILMGQGAGGAVSRMQMGSVTLPFYPPKSLMKGIFVNRAAQRFMPEDVYQGRAGEIALLHQDGRVWLVLDDETFARPVFAGGEIVAGESLAELEREIGFPDGALQATVALYNRFAERGEDPLFHKAAEYVKPLVKPPFGAIDLSWDKAIYAAFTLGGLATDVRARVLTPDGVAVPGLYAAGRTAASISSPGYSSGTSIGEAMIFGRIAGREAARA
ncbi:MAG TPA: FAD-dependent oxidoreductase [Myxococcota bacterium]|nr:FAD-dependent oxidoreductase [Myxococcota bacterium]